MSGWNPREPTIKKEIIDVVNEFWWKGYFKRSTKITQVIESLAREIISLRRLNPEATTVPLQILEPYNGKIIDCPHMHLYIEGFSDRWAIPIPVDKFSNTDDLIKSLTDFLNYCNVVDKPSVGAMSLNGY